ncbi:MAG TPA: tryptophan 2,3-dioxygenase [Euzebya sp.]|nr:tryptophan 2,3-dioxygenase [Euzebya sp.]
MTAPTPYDPSDEGAQMAFDGRMAYADYLRLDRVLVAQDPVSDAHDEMLFIIQHQTSELWMKLAIHELVAARAAIVDGRMRESFKMLSRVARIFEQLNNAWDVLRTMTPSEYTSFRDDLGQASGFQSWQYRAIEYLVGNKNAALLRPHAHVPEVLADLTAHLEAPSLYDEVLALLSREGFELAPKVLQRDWTTPYEADDTVLRAWHVIYRDPKTHWTAYELAEKLVDLEDYFRRWRFNHVTTVERIIGLKRGTGGTSGTQYLRRMLDVVLFPELWDVRTTLYYVTP